MATAEKLKSIRYSFYLAVKKFFGSFFLRTEFELPYKIGSFYREESPIKPLVRRCVGKRHEVFVIYVSYRDKRLGIGFLAKES